MKKKCFKISFAKNFTQSAELWSKFCTAYLISRYLLTLKALSETVEDNLVFFFLLLLLFRENKIGISYESSTSQKIYMKY